MNGDLNGGRRGATPRNDFEPAWPETAPVDTNTLEGRRRLIDGFVNSVVVYDDYILVTFNYKESAEHITFEQIERSDLSSLRGPKIAFFVRNRRFFAYKVR